MTKKQTLKHTFTQQLRRSINRHESGQIIILMAFGMIVLLAAVGLAIDGGRLVYLKRDAQNATDAAILAATYALCAGQTGTLVEDAGYAAATDNGFTTDSSTTVTVNSPPVNNPNSDVNGKTSYVEVEIEAHIPSYFIQLVYGDDLSTTSYGIGNCNPGFDPTVYNAAIMSFSENCVQGIDFNGSQGNPSLISGGLVTNGNVNISSSGVITESVDLQEDSTFTGNSTMTIVGGVNTFTEAIEYPELLDIEDFAPNGEIAQWVIDNAGIDMYHDFSSASGNLFQVPDNANGEIEGLYYIGPNVTTAKFNNVDVGPLGVTIVAHNGIDFSGSTLLRSFEPLKYSEYELQVIVFSLADNRASCTTSTGSATVKMSGFTQWEGLFYVPYGYVSLPGSGVDGIGAVVANKVDLPISSGSLTYDPSVLPIIPPTIDIAE